MLIIRRRIGESLFIGDRIQVEVLDICGAQIKIGIEAPREVVILRSEVRLTAEANRLAARNLSPALLSRLSKKFHISGQEPPAPPDKDN